MVLDAYIDQGMRVDDREQVRMVPSASSKKRSVLSAL